MADEILQENRFLGSQKDITPQDAPANSYFEGNDIQINSQKNKSKKTINPNDGNSLAFGIGSITETQNQKVKITVDISSANITHQLSITDNLGNSYIGASVSSGLAEPLRYDDLVTKISNSFTAAVPGTSVITTPGDLAYFVMEISGTGQSYNIIESISGNPSAQITLQQKITNAQFGPFLECANLEIGQNLFILSSNGTIGRVGVAVKDTLTNVWVYTVLAQSQDLPLSPDNVTLLKGEVTNNTVRLYWVDASDKPRRFYVKLQTVWTLNYAMLFAENFPTDIGNPDGFYIYNNIGTQTQQQIFANSITVDDIVVNNSGGVFKSGNIRAAIRVKSGSGFTLFGIISGVTSIPIRDLNELYGGGGYPPSETNSSTTVTGVTTTKSITLSISGIDDSSFSEYEVAIIEYIEGTVSSYVLGPFPVSGQSFSITLKGNENKRPLDLTEFQQFQPVIKTASLNEILENKYFLANVEVELDPDLSTWTKTILFAPGNIDIRTAEIPTQGNLVTNASSEYNASGFIFGRLGYMYNDTYRVGAKYRFKNGLVTSVYFGADIKIENDVNGNLGNLTDSGVTVLYSYYINIKNVDFTTAPAINGIPFIDLIESVEIVRCDCIPEVLFTGYAMLSTDIFFQGSDVFYYNSKNFALGLEFGTYAPDPTYLADYTYIGKIVSQDYSALGITVPTTGFTTLINFGQPQLNNFIGSTAGNIEPGVNAVLNTMEYGGYFTAANNPPLLLAEVSNDAFNAESRTLGQITIPPVVGPVNVRVSGTLDTPANGPDSKYVTSQPRGLSFRSISQLDAITPYNDYGGRYVQVFAENPGKYGLETLGLYYGTGTVLKIGGINGYSFTNVAIFGGDTFTQKAFQKIIFDGRIPPATIFAEDTPRGSVSYYAQNRINAQFRNAPFVTNDPVPSSSAYPFNVDNLTDWLATSTEEPIIFSQGYMPDNGVIEDTVFLPEQNRFSLSIKDTTAYYSDPRLDEDLFDPYTIFRIGNSKTYQSVDGPLIGMYKFRENLFMLQRTNVFTQPISPNIQVATNDIAGTILGTGSVLGTKIIPLSKNGTILKTASFRRISKDGKENIYWLAIDKKQLYRYGGDGDKNIGKDNFYESFFEANNDFVLNEKDIIFGNDPYFDEVLTTVNCTQDDQLLWEPDTEYPQGTRVYLSIAGNKQGFIAKRDVPENLSPVEIINQFQYWEIDRQSQYTLAFNERNNTFGSFYIFRPNAYATYNDTFLSFLNGMLIGGEYYFFEHHTTDDCVYYNNLLVGNPFVISHTNKSPKDYKHFLKIFIDSLLAPTRLEVFNEQENIMTFSDQAEIISYRNRFRATIRHDATISANNPAGANNVSRTKKMMNEWFFVKIFLQKGINLNSIVSILFPKWRRLN